MAAPSLAERTLFLELTRIFIALKDCPYGKLEEAIEQRLREFMRSEAGQNTRGLEITLRWEMPEGPTSWPIYATQFRTLSDATVKETRAIANDRS